MAVEPISALTALGAAPATGDLLVLVDISDTTQAPTGTTKRMTVANLFTTPTFTGATNVTGLLTAAVGISITTVGLAVVAGGITVTAGKITCAVSTAAAASLNIPRSTAPSAPASGDMWYDNADGALKFRDSGGTTRVINWT